MLNKCRASCNPVFQCAVQAAQRKRQPVDSRRCLLVHQHLSMVSDHVICMLYMDFIAVAVAPQEFVAASVCFFQFLLFTAYTVYCVNCSELRSLYVGYLSILHWLCEHCFDECHANFMHVPYFCV